MVFQAEQARALGLWKGRIAAVLFDGDLAGPFVD